MQKLTLGLGAAGLAGFLLASGSLAPVVADVVALTAKPSGDEPQVEKVAAWTDPQATVEDWSDTWMTGDGRDEWSDVRQVPQVDGPSRPGLPARPAIAPPEDAKRIFRGGVPRNELDWKLEAMKSCPQQRGPGATVKNLTVTPAAGAVAVSWWDIGDPDTSAYELTAVPVMGGKGVMQRATITPPGGCQTVRARITGLTTGQTYKVWLNAVNTSKVNNRVYRPSRGQSETFVAL